MKKTIGLAAMIMVLSGCQTMQYVVDETFPDKGEYLAYQSENDYPKDNLVASTDNWIKRHLW